MEGINIPTGLHCKGHFPSDHQWKRSIFPRVASEMVSIFRCVTSGRGGFNLPTGHQWVGGVNLPKGLPGERRVNLPMGGKGGGQFSRVTSEGGVSVFPPVANGRGILHPPTNGRGQKFKGTLQVNKKMYGIGKKLHLSI